GPANGRVKNQIFGLNSASMYSINLRASYPRFTEDKFAQIKKEYRTAGTLDSLRDNAAHGWIAKRSTQSKPRGPATPSPPNGRGSEPFDDGQRVFSPVRICVRACPRLAAGDDHTMLCGGRHCEHRNASSRAGLVALAARRGAASIGRRGRRMVESRCGQSRDGA